MYRAILAGCCLLLPVWALAAPKPVHPTHTFSHAAHTAGLSDASVLAVDGSTDGVPYLLHPAPIQLRLERDSQLVDPRMAVVEKALSAVGISYRYGMADLERGVDCSGLVRAVYKAAANLDLPRKASQQAKMGKSVGKGTEGVGDLLFFNTRGHRHSHVGLKVGEHTFVHASTIERKVTVSDLNNRYWRKRFTEARHIELPQVSRQADEPVAQPLAMHRVESVPHAAALAKVALRGN